MLMILIVSIQGEDLGCKIKNNHLAEDFYVFMVINDQLHYGSGKGAKLNHERSC